MGEAKRKADAINGGLILEPRGKAGIEVTAGEPQRMGGPAVHRRHDEILVGLNLDAGKVAMGFGGEYVLMLPEEAVKIAEALRMCAIQVNSATLAKAAGAV